MVCLVTPIPPPQALTGAGYTIQSRVYRYLLGKSLDIVQHVTSPGCAFLSSCRSRKERMPMKIHTYGERDYAFGQTIVTLRTAMNLTQVALAQFLGVSRGA